MKSGHNHSLHSSGPAPDSTGNIGLAFFLNLGFATLELIGGYFTGSIAIVADAVHDFGDSLTLGIAFILQKLSTRGRTKHFTYGYGRLSLLSALISSLVLVIGSVLVLIKAVPRFWEPIPPNELGMMLLAVLGVGVNAVAAFRLKHGTTRNEKVLSWHFIEDLLGWIAVFLGAIAILYTGWSWIDPLLACGVAVFILINVVKNLWETILLFLQRVPEDFKEGDLKAELMGVKGIRDVHDVHAWSIDGSKNVLSIHIAVDESISTLREFEAIKGDVRHRAEKFGRFHVTIEPESRDGTCQERCDSFETRNDENEPHEH